MTEEVIVLRVDEIMEKIVSDQTGTFLHIEKTILREWIEDVLMEIVGSDYANLNFPEEE